MRTVQKENGFSLVELMIALVLGLFLIGSVSLLYVSTRATAIDAEALSRIQENVRFAADYLVRDIRTAGFDDVGDLSVGDVTQIDKFARILDLDDNPLDLDDNPALRIRYAGRGHCGARFKNFEVVQNTYRVEDGTLLCEGRVWDGTDWVFGSGDPEDVLLVSGLSGISFEMLCADDGTNCHESTGCSKKHSNRCVGVEITLEFPGLRSMQGSEETRSVQLVAAFRNTVMDILYDAVMDQEENQDTPD